MRKWKKVEDQTMTSANETWCARMTKTINYFLWEQNSLHTVSGTQNLESHAKNIASAQWQTCAQCGVVITVAEDFGLCGLHDQIRRDLLVGLALQVPRPPPSDEEGMSQAARWVHCSIGIHRNAVCVWLIRQPSVSASDAAAKAVVSVASGAADLNGARVLGASSVSIASVSGSSSCF